MADRVGTPNDDVLVGSQDADAIFGGLGDDTLTGGEGADRFVYDSLNELSFWTGAVGTKSERITDFGFQGQIVDGAEVMDFSAIEGLVFVGDGGFTETGRAEFGFRKHGSDGLILVFDGDGNGTTDRYLVLDEYVNAATTTGDLYDTPLFTNIVNSPDLFGYHYRVGTAANDKLVGTDPGSGPNGFGNDRMRGFDGDDRLYGKAGSDELFGEAGNDRLDGGADDDIMVGGTGNDTYFVDLEFDTVIEQENEGIDTVNTSSYYTPSFANIENITLVGDAYRAYGNDLNNDIKGNGNDNIIGAGSGRDVLFGAGGSDRLMGDAGDDWIRGGLGNDILEGGAGADKFAYYDIREIGRLGDRSQDVVIDFQGRGSDPSGTSPDRIDLRRIDADVSTGADDAFRFIGQAAFTGSAGELRYFRGTAVVDDPDPVYGDPTYTAPALQIEGDVNGDGLADFQLAVLGDRPLMASDFVA